MLCKVAPAKSDVHMEDVHRAGGIMAILGELEKGGLLNTALPTVHSPTLADALEDWDVGRTRNNKVHEFYAAAPGGCRRRPRSARRAAGTRSTSIREKGVIRSRRACVQQGRRPRGAGRQYRARRLHR